MKCTNIQGVATRCGLEGSGVQIPVRVRFSAPFHTGAGAPPQPPVHRVKRPERKVDHLPSSAEVIEWRCNSTPPYAVMT
jgi:hypothetical protein